MTDSIGMGPFVALTKGFNDDERPRACGRFLAVLDAHGDPLWAHTLANLIVCDPKPVAIVAGPAGVVAAFSHFGDIAIDLPGHPVYPLDKDGCLVVRFPSVPPFSSGSLRAIDPPLVKDDPRHLLVRVDGHVVP